MINPDIPGNCTRCPKGTYSDEPDSTSCTPCPEGKTSQEGATDVWFCYSGAGCGPGKSHEHVQNVKFTIRPLD